MQFIWDFFSGQFSSVFGPLLLRFNKLVNYHAENEVFIWNTTCGCNNIDSDEILITLREWGWKKTLAQVNLLKSAGNGNEDLSRQGQFPLIDYLQERTSP